MSIHPTRGDPRVIRAYAHPVRAQAMELLESRVISPAEIAAILGRPVGTIAYHVRQLEAAGLIELVERRRSRGAIEHHYTAPRSPTISDSDWSSLPISDRRGIVARGLRRLVPELDAAAVRSGFERPGSDVQRVRVALDPLAWSRATSAFAAALQEVEALVDEAKLRIFERPPHRPPTAVAVMMLFKERGDLERPRPATRRRDPIDLADERMLAAVAHPLRSEIFRLLRQSELSPREIASSLGAPLSNTSYHVRQLVEMGLIRLTQRRERCGALQHYYVAASVDESRSWPQPIVDRTVEQTGAAMRRAANLGRFDAADVHYTRTGLPVDEHSWSAVCATLDAARTRVVGLAGAAEARAARGAAQVEDVNVVTMLFERMPPPTSNPASQSASPRR